MFLRVTEAQLDIPTFLSHVVGLFIIYCKSRLVVSSPVLIRYSVILQLLY